MSNSKSLKFVILLKTLIVSTIFISLILFPKEVFEASLRGLNAWFSIVLPALLPFFIMSELLASLGITKFLGILLEKAMRPIFNLPGASAFVLAVGYTSGAPISSILTADLRRKQLLTRNEAERLICFTNNASPLFMFGAVAVGMFKQPEIGIIIALSHYLANIIIGICLRFLGPKGMHYNSQDKTVKKALQTLIDEQHNNKPLGALMGDAVKKSINNITQIGGFIILFSVLIELLYLFEIINVMAIILTTIFKNIMFDFQLAKGIASGFIEMTIGSKLIAESASSLKLKVAAVSLVLGWAGLSIQAQAMSMIADTDIRFFPFVIARFFHGIMAAIISLIIYNPTIEVIVNYTAINNLAFNSLNVIIYSLISFWLIICILIITSLIFLIIKRKIIFFM